MCVRPSTNVLYSVTYSTIYVIPISTPDSSYILTGIGSSLVSSPTNAVIDEVGAIMWMVDSSGIVKIMLDAPASSTRIYATSTMAGKMPFTTVQAITWDPDSSLLWVIEQSTRNVFSLDPNDIFATVKSQVYQFQTPRGVAYDSASDAVVVSQSSGVISTTPPLVPYTTAEISFDLTLTTRMMTNPQGVTWLQSQSRFYVCDSGMRTVHSWISNKQLNHQQPSYALSTPTAIAIDRTNQLLYVCDTGNSRIARVYISSASRSSTSRLLTPGVALSPRAIALDSSRDLLYVSSGLTIVIFTVNHASTNWTQFTTLSTSRATTAFWLDPVKNALYAIQSGQLIEFSVTNPLVTFVVHQPTIGSDVTFVADVAGNRLFIGTLNPSGVAVMTLPATTYSSVALELIQPAPFAAASNCIGAVVRGNELFCMQPARGGTGVLVRFPMSGGGSSVNFEYSFSIDSPASLAWDPSGDAFFTINTLINNIARVPINDPTASTYLFKSLLRPRYQYLDSIGRRLFIIDMMTYNQQVKMMPLGSPESTVTLNPTSVSWASPRGIAFDYASELVLVLDRSLGLVRMPLNNINSAAAITVGAKCTFATSTISWNSLTYDETTSTAYAAVSVGSTRGILAIPINSPGSCYPIIRPLQSPQSMVWNQLTGKMYLSEPYMNRILVSDFPTSATAAVSLPGSCALLGRPTQMVINPLTQDLYALLSSSNVTIKVPSGDAAACSAVSTGLLSFTISLNRIHLNHITNKLFLFDASASIRRIAQINLDTPSASAWLHLGSYIVSAMVTDPSSNKLYGFGVSSYYQLYVFDTSAALPVTPLIYQFRDWSGGEVYSMALDSSRGLLYMGSYNAIYIINTAKPTIATQLKGIGASAFTISMQSIYSIAIDETKKMLYVLTSNSDQPLIAINVVRPGNASLLFPPLLADPSLDLEENTQILYFATSSAVSRIRIDDVSRWYQLPSSQVDTSVVDFTLHSPWLYASSGSTLRAINLINSSLNTDLLFATGQSVTPYAPVFDELTQAILIADYTANSIWQVDIAKPENSKTIKFPSHNTHTHIKAIATRLNHFYRDYSLNLA